MGIERHGESVTGKSEGGRRKYRTRIRIGYGYGYGYGKMRIPKAFLDGAATGKSLELGPEAYHHIARVLRRGKGDSLVVFDGRGGAFQAVVEDHDPARDLMKVSVGEPIEDARSGGAPLALAVGIPRGDGFEVALRWASEMGLARMIPLITARGVVKLPEGEGSGGGKLERWRRIARESAGQCGRPIPLAVDPPIALEKLLGKAEEHPSRWIAVPDGSTLAGSGLLEALSGAGPDSGPSPSTPPKAEILILIGPEGGFSPDEVARAASRGFRRVGFPTPVLRTPTAVAYLAALASVVEWL
jgi:16S rRNA (uracil1498-N3)-methyltransferase